MGEQHRFWRELRRMGTPPELPLCVTRFAAYLPPIFPNLSICLIPMLSEAENLPSSFIIQILFCFENPPPSFQPPLCPEPISIPSNSLPPFPVAFYSMGLFAFPNPIHFLPSFTHLFLPPSLLIINCPIPLPFFVRRVRPFHSLHFLPSSSPPQLSSSQFKSITPPFPHTHIHLWFSAFPHLTPQLWRPSSLRGLHLHLQILPHLP